MERILTESGVENDAAVGVQLAGGETIKADWVISAADGHATIYELLGGKYVDAAIENNYKTFEFFPATSRSHLESRSTSAISPPPQPSCSKSPLQVDPDTGLSQVSFRIFHFDPAFAPAGKTAVTCFLPTRNFAYWAQLRADHPERYRAEKHRVAESVIDVLEKRIPGARAAIEVVDVATPASIFRYTGNWKGSMEGWLPTPRTGFRPLPKTLPGLRKFMMVGGMDDPRRRPALRSDDSSPRDPGHLQTGSGSVHAAVGRDCSLISLLNP